MFLLAVFGLIAICSILLEFFPDKEPPRDLAHDALVREYWAWRATHASPEYQALSIAEKTCARWPRLADEEE